MAYNTCTLQGNFISTGVAVTLPFVSGVDWLWVYNFTQLGLNPNPGVAVQAYWQRGFSQGAGVIYTKTNSTNALTVDTVTTGGFTLVDTSGNPVGASLTLSAVSAANPPVVTTGSTASLSVGDVVRIANVTGAQQLGGIDFTIGNSTFTGTTFSLDYMVPIAAGTTGSFRRIAFDPIFYPRKRTITSITQASPAVVKLSVTHQYVVGQSVRLNIPAVYGMQELNGRLLDIVAINTTTNTISLNVDSTGFTAFAFPVTANVPFTPAETVPVGEETDTGNFYNPVFNPNLLDDATVNLAITGIQLAGGANSPAGANLDSIFWIGGKTFNGS